MKDGSIEACAKAQPFIAPAHRPEDPSSRIAARSLTLGPLAASLGFHAVIVVGLILLALLSLTPADDLKITVTLTSLGPGAAGPSGGIGGGGQAAEASTDPRPAAMSATEAPQTQRRDEAEAQQAAEAPSPLPAAAEVPSTPPAEPKSPPPPRRKPPSTRAGTTGPARTPPSDPVSPTPDAAQIAAARLDRPVPEAPGLGSGPGGKGGLGTAEAGAGQGALGAGPIDGPGDDYLDRLRHWLNKYKHYPEEAQKQKQHGQLVVSFTILRDGTVRDPQVERSSGYPLLDAAALAMLREASPVPALPEKYRASQVAVDLPIAFSIGFFDRVF
jgi:protein TonB